MTMEAMVMIWTLMMIIWLFDAFNFGEIPSTPNKFPNILSNRPSHSIPWSSFWRWQYHIMPVCKEVTKSDVLLQLRATGWMMMTIFIFSNIASKLIILTSNFDFHFLAVKFGESVLFHHPCVSLTYSEHGLETVKLWQKICLQCLQWCHQGELVQWCEIWNIPKQSYLVKSWCWCKWIPQYNLDSFEAAPPSIWVNFSF